MYDIQLFTNELFGSVRSVEINNQPWFVGADVAACLGYVKTRNAIADHVDTEDKLMININNNTAPNQGGIPGNPNVIVINESGLYSLIFGSKLPTAKAFKHWVTSVILPTMRQIGFNRSLEVLQNENMRLQNENKYLNNQLTTAGEINTTQAINNMDNLYSIYYVLNNPYISDDMKRAMLTYDLPNGEIDLKSEIQRKVDYLFRDEQEV